ncbi:MAG: hypothetical protein EBY61_03920 [Actinobacteria bacterium]|nr:hypothetical protein [Actinomycetota bacterium]
MTTVDVYLERIGAERPDVLDLDALARLQHAHLVAVPFENLDVFHRVPVSVDQDVVLAKIVGGRGGWCFENNGAFAWLLEQLGFRVMRIGAAVLIDGPNTVIDHHTIDWPFATRLLGDGADRVTLLADRLKLRRGDVTEETEIAEADWNDALWEWFRMRPPGQVPVYPMKSRSLRDVRIDNLKGAAPGPQQEHQTHAAVDRAADGHRRDRVDDLTIDYRRQQRATSEGEGAAQRRCSAGNALHRLQGERDRRGGNERAGCRCDGDEHRPHNEGRYAVAHERSDEHHREATGVGAIGEQRESGGTDAVDVAARLPDAETVDG